MRKPGGHARALAALLAVALIAGGVTAVPVYAQAGTFAGGAIDAPQYILNDHTAFGFRWGTSGDITGLEASADYYVKVRFTVDLAPSPSTNRGFTWNPAQERWVQQSEAWTEFPVVTTDADGKIAEPLWAYAKFGDENTTGTYYVHVSLQKVGSASTLNSEAPPQSTVIDAATQGGWVHNGIAIGDANTRVAIRDEDAATDDDPPRPLALGKTEVNSLDDDGDGVMDNED